MRKFFFMFLALILATTILFAFSGQTLAQDAPEIGWIEGPKTVELGEVAQVGMDQSMIFANASDTKKLKEYIGEPVDNTEMGMIAPNSDSFDWFVMFDYDAIGYVKDDEKADLDSQKILEAIKKATDEANKIRVKNGFSAFNVIGWYEEPHYDSVTHNLTWAVLGEDAEDHSRAVNFDTRLLGRGGYMGVKLVTSPEDLESYKPSLNTILTNFSWKPGKNYAEWKPGDKVAEIGLTALIAGSAGAIAAKTGLLSKIWYFIVAGIVAIVAFFRKVFKRIFRRNEKPITYYDSNNNQT